MGQTMRNVVVAGVGMTQIGSFPDGTTRGLAELAVAEALTDAGVAASEIGFVAYANAAAGILTGQESVRGEVVLRYTGLAGKPIINVENACASGSSAFHLAWLQVASGMCDVALAVGAEKMTHPDRSAPLRAMLGGTDLSELDELREKFGGTDDRPIFMDIYAAAARTYMTSTGATQADFAAVAAKSHDYAALNPKAQFRKRFSIDQILAARPIIDPLTLPMCSPIGDGAAAIILVSEAVARRNGVTPIFVKASAIATGKPDEPEATPAAKRAAVAAYEFAGVSPGDLDVVELHDATAPAELSLYEDILLCRPAEGLALFRSGATGPGGRTCVNTSGGLVSRGHPVGATGCAQLVELTEQLRGRSGPRQKDGARVALAQNGGGYIKNDAAVAVVTILST